MGRATSAAPDRNDDGEGSARLGFWSLLAVFLRLGVTSFGGPVAHLGYFRHEFVQRRRWLSESAYADLVALCQFLPGPASSQVGFAVGLAKGGWRGGRPPGWDSTLPSAFLMVAFAYGVTSLGDTLDSGWLRGLKICAVAVVAHAVWGMATQLCPDRSRATIALAAAAVVLAYPAALTQVGVIVLGALVGYGLYRGNSAPIKAGRRSGSRRAGAFFLLLFFVLLAGLPMLAALTRTHLVLLVEGFYRAGALVFGGGHVVLPLLQATVVPPGWVSDDAFLAGYSAAQAVPGPLFTFAAYLGAVMAPAPNGWLGGAIALAVIFLPSFLLVVGVLPYWEAVRVKPAAQAALKGTNAAVVGILLAALYDPVWLKGIHGSWDLLLGLAAFGMLQYWKAPSWAAVAVCAGAGMVLGGTTQ